MTVDITTLISRNASVASVELFDLTNPIVSLIGVATGSAKREPGDMHDEAIAVDLAAGRALENLGRQLRRRGEAKVREASRQTEEKQAKLRRKNAESALRDMRKRLTQI